MATYNTTTVDNQDLTIKVEKVVEKFFQVTLVTIYVKGIKMHQTVLEWEKDDNTIDVRPECNHDVHRCQTCEKEYIVGNHNTLMNCTYCLYQGEIEQDFEDSLQHEDPREEI
tara:strand:+ start:92 stop:427 length:336 start_codon:yes stop_codon:yes gene_type:complete